jgi:Na+-translocating ferredoxin:NAD+ oxidoreductase RnfG subunit
MRDIVKLAVIPLIISAIAAGALAYTNQITAPQIASSKETAAKEARTVVMPDATDFVVVSMISSLLLRKQQVSPLMNLIRYMKLIKMEF